MKTFAMIECDLPDNEKIVKAGALCELLYIRSVLFSKERLTDGKIHARRLATVAAGIPGDSEALAARLVEVGLWRRDDEGWFIPNWADRNKTKAQVEEEREAARLRQNKKRGKLEAVTADVTEMSHVTSTVTEPDCHATCHGDVTPTRVQSTEYRDNSTLETTYVVSGGIPPGSPAKKKLPDEESLDAFVAAWNSLPLSIVPHHIRDARGKSVVRAWTKAMGDEEIRPHCLDPAAVMQAIRSARYLVEKWRGWDFEWLLCGRNQSGVSNLVKLMRGGHNGDGDGNSRTDRQKLLAPGPGQRFDAAAERPSVRVSLGGGRPGGAPGDDRSKTGGPPSS